ncbi:MAG: peroxiredoxin family protein [Dehalococcoidia bacterium]|jgi:peroxiredoxin|nr:peroxiredoxin family protein [Dehalococcoidia bacterium]MDP6511287.1 peroxiredoxin family protein [Dehalococcoidia bacterium]MDP6782249.1 peroxiredoxin family protein [Dehalococcoidia bacterium]|tara:strand:+ start:248 stop:709 length:462 start_codon:yes stop_codon:yes gene_type:complete
MPRLKPGDKAPDFTLKYLEGKGYRLYDHLSDRKTVLLFFRGEWYPICNLQLHSLQEKLADFQKADAQILAVSNDTPENTRNLAAKHQLGFPVLAGLGRDVVQAYDLFFNEEKGCAEPAVFILRPDATVAYAALQSGPRGRPSNDGLLAIVSRI